MRILLNVTVFVCGLTTCMAQTKEFSWLIGEWRMKGSQTFEKWSLASDRISLEGSSYRIKDNRAVLLEETKIIFSGNSFYYVADVAGEQEPIHFSISSYDHAGFVAENPDHDFPKIIRYKFKEEDGKEFIDASIEGNGKKIAYSFEKVR